MDKWTLTTFGYTRNISKEFDIEIPNVIIKLITLYYKILITSKILSDEINILYNMICIKLNKKKHIIMDLVVIYFGKNAIK